MRLKISKNVEYVNIVTIHGGKYIRCGNGRKPYGVVVNAVDCTIIDFDGKIHIFKMPEGIMIQGRTNLNGTD